MKFQILLVTLALASCAHKSYQHHDQERIPASDPTISAMFSPWEGTLAFDKMYKAISGAKHEAKVTVYS